MGNSLNDTFSLYLKQHKNNPIDWYQWTELAFTRAKQENKIILVSIGYSSCHWCHVMAKESFNDELNAEYLNKNYICIKVDREEFPEVDNLYQNIYQRMTGSSGGWPLTMYLSPNKKPIFAATYLPSDTSINKNEKQLSFLQISKNIIQEYKKDSDKIEQFGSQVLKSLQGESIQTNTDSKTNDLNLKIMTNIESYYDWENGGMVGAPKFPMSPIPRFLLDTWLMQNNSDMAIKIGVHYLNSLNDSGLYDHVGGGFFRYCVDDKWKTPHFEKMLSDNSQLLFNYGIAYNLTYKHSYYNLIDETVRYIYQQAHPQVWLFSSSLDADTTQGEGHLYKWRIKDLKNILSKKQFTLLTLRFKIDTDIDLEQTVHLSDMASISEVANQTNDYIQSVRDQLKTISSLLLKHRNTLPQPEKDNKCLLSTNSHLAEALIIAGRYTHKPDYISSGLKIIDTIKKNFLSNEEHTSIFADGTAYQTPTLDDYGYLFSALITSLQQEWDFSTYALTLKIADNILEQYEDKEKGGFFLGKDDALIDIRLKTYTDGSNINSQAKTAISLIHLYHLSGLEKYLVSAERCIENGCNVIDAFDIFHVGFATAKMILNEHPQLIIIRGPQDSLVNNWKIHCLANYHPNRLVFAIQGRIPQKFSSHFNHCINSNTLSGYVCNNRICKTPIKELHNLLKEIDNTNTIRAVKYSI